MKSTLIGWLMSNLKVNDFNCTTSMLKDPKRDFYSLWLSGKCYSLADSKSGTDIGPEESNTISLAMGNSGPRKSVARLRPMRSIANALGAVMRSRPSKVSVNFGMHLGADNDSRKSSKIGTLGMTRRKMLDPKMELKQVGIL